MTRSPALVLEVSTLFSGGGGGPDPEPGDTTPPTLTNASPMDGATNFSITGSIFLTFSEAVVAVSGKNFVLRDVTAGSDIETIAVTNTDKVMISGTMMTINRSSSLSNGNDYRLTAPAGYVADAAGNPIGSSLNLDFRTTPAGTAFASYENSGNPVTSLAYRGVTINLSTGLRYFYSENGDPVFITEAATTITSMTPASAQTGGYWANGAMVNPRAFDSEENPINEGAEYQGFDEIASFDTGSEGFYPYGGNIDPGATGSAYSISQGQSVCVVKAIRKSGVTLGANNPIEAYVAFHFMGVAPPEDGEWFAPAYSKVTKSWQFKHDDTRTLSVLRDLDATGLSYIMPADEALTEIDTRKMHTVPMWWHSGEGGRRMQVNGDYASYSAQYGGPRARLMLSLFDDSASDADRIALAKILTQWGINRIGAYEEGVDMSAGAGQFFGYIEFPYLAGFVLGSQSLLDKARGLMSNSVNQCFWVPQSLVGFPVLWDSGSTGGGLGRVGVTYRQEDVDLPEWGRSFWAPSGETAPAKFDGSLRQCDSGLHGNYRDTQATTDALPLEILAICLLQNGPEGQTGDAALRDGGSANDPDNIRAAPLAYCDRQRVWQPNNAHGVNYFGSSMRALWDAWRPSVPSAVWIGRPDVQQSQSYIRFTTGSAGQIDFDCSADDYATETITHRYVARSLDNVQFVEVDLDTDDTYTFTGLLQAVDYYCRWSQESASGVGPWSPNWVMELNGTGIYDDIRGLTTSGGTSQSGGPTNTVTPVIHRKIAPRWKEGPLYEPVTYLPDILTLQAGVGDWTGGSPISFGYQWKEDTGGGFGNISGATSFELDFLDQTPGAAVKCTVTATANGTPVSVDTNTVTIPSAETFPTGVYLSTTFDTNFPHAWPSVYSGASAVNADLEYDPYYYWDDNEATVGAFSADASNTNPVMTLPLGNAVAGETIYYQIRVPIGIYENRLVKAGRNTYLRIRTSAGVNWVEHVIASSYNETVVECSGSFTIPGGASDVSLEVVVYVNDNTGAGNAGNPALSEAHVWRPTAPNQFRPSMWDLSGTDGDLIVDLLEMPRTNGSATTAVRYNINGASFVASGVSSGSFGIAADTTDEIRILAVNGFGAGPASTPKTVA